MGKYDAERLGALWGRVERLEHTLERVGTLLEGEDPNLARALEVLREGIVEEFREALLASRDTSDEQLDFWLAQRAEEAAEKAGPS